MMVCVRDGGFRLQTTAERLTSPAPPATLFDRRLQKFGSLHSWATRWGAQGSESGSGFLTPHPYLLPTVVAA